MQDDPEAREQGKGPSRLPINLHSNQNNSNNKGIKFGLIPLSFIKILRSSDPAEVEIESPDLIYLKGRLEKSSHQGGSVDHLKG